MFAASSSSSASTTVATQSAQAKEAIDILIGCAPVIVDAYGGGARVTSVGDANLFVSFNAWLNEDENSGHEAFVRELTQKLNASLSANIMIRSELQQQFIRGAKSDTKQMPGLAQILRVAAYQPSSMVQYHINRVSLALAKFLILPGVNRQAFVQAILQHKKELIALSNEWNSHWKSFTREQMASQTQPILEVDEDEDEAEVKQEADPVQALDAYFSEEEQTNLRRQYEWLRLTNCLKDNFKSRLKIGTTTVTLKDITDKGYLHASLEGEAVTLFLYVTPGDEENIFQEIASFITDNGLGVVEVRENEAELIVREVNEDNIAAKMSGVIYNAPEFDDVLRRLYIIFDMHFDEVYQFEIENFVSAKPIYQGKVCMSRSDYQEENSAIVLRFYVDNAETLEHLQAEINHLFEENNFGNISVEEIEGVWTLTLSEVDEAAINQYYQANCRSDRRAQDKQRKRELEEKQEAARAQQDDSDTDEDTDEDEVQQEYERAGTPMPTTAMAAAASPASAGIGINGGDVVDEADDEHDSKRLRRSRDGLCSVGLHRSVARDEESDDEVKEVTNEVGSKRARLKEFS